MERLTNKARTRFQLCDYFERACAQRVPQKFQDDHHGDGCIDLKVNLRLCQRWLSASGHDLLDDMGNQDCIMCALFTMEFPTER